MNILIVDDDEEVREILAFAFESEFNVKIIEANCGNQAIEIIESRKQEIDLIVCDYNMPNGNGGEVYEHLLKTEFNIPYVFCSSDHIGQHSEFKNRSKLFGSITKPQIFDGVIEIISSLVQRKEQSENSEISKNIDEYCEAGLSLISKVDILPTDIYLKVGSKIILAFRRGESDFEEGLQKYQDKGVESFLIKRKDSKELICFLSQKILAVFEDENKSSNEKVVDAHAAIANTVKELGMSEGVIRAAKKSVENTLSYFEQNEEAREFKRRLFGQIDGENYLTTHSVGMSFIAVGILKNTNWDSHENRGKLVLAGFMHDLSIRTPEFSESIFLQHSDLLNMKEHCQQSVELLAKLKDVPEDVYKIIGEHHERPDGSGFPRGLDGSQIAPLSSLFIFSHDVVDAVLKVRRLNESVNTENINNILEQIDYNRGNFKKCYEAFKTANIFEEDSK